MSGTDRARRQFGRTAAAYVTSATHARGEDLDRIERVVVEHGGDHLVDVGTGVGHTLRRLAPRFHSAVGIDATREMLEAGVGVLASSPSVRALLVEADAAALPIASRSVDVVTSRLAAHHFTDAEKAFREVARVLRPGGVFVFVDNFAPDDPELDRFINELERLRDPSHVRSHTARGWLRLVEAAGIPASIDTELASTKLDVEGWLARSQTPPSRAAEVRRRLKGANAQAKAAFRIGENSFTVHKLLLVGRA